MNAQDQLERKPIAVNTFYTHQFPHIDELLAILFIRLFGKELFPGACRAVIELIEDSNFSEYLEKWYHDRGILPIGIWHGMFDEHRLERSPEGTKDVTAADLVAEYLGISQLPKIKLLLEFVRRVDLTATTTSLDLHQSINLLSVYSSMGIRELELWSRLVLDLFLGETVQINGHDGKFSWPIRDEQYRILRSLFDRWLTEEGHGTFDEVKDKPEFRQLCKFINQLSTRPPSQTFDIAEMVALLTAAYQGDSEVAYGWVRPVFESKLGEQEEFVKAVKVVQNSPIITVPSWHADARNHLIRMIVVEDVDTSCLAKACRAALNPLPDILVVKMTDGHVQFFNLNPRSRVILSIVRSLRLQEQVRMKIPREQWVTGFEEIGIPGALEVCEKWYFFTNHLGDFIGFFNGTWSRLSLPITVIPFETILETVKEAIRMDGSPDDWYDFCDYHLGQPERGWRPEYLREIPIRRDSQNGGGHQHRR